MIPVWFSSAENCSSSSSKADNQVHWFCFHFHLSFSNPFPFPTKQVSLDISVEGSLLDAATPGAESYGVIFDDGALSISTINSFVVTVDLVRKKREKKEKEREKERGKERERKKKKRKKKKKKEKGFVGYLGVHLAFCRTLFPRQIWFFSQFGKVFSNFLLDDFLSFSPFFFFFFFLRNHA